MSKEKYASPLRLNIRTSRRLVIAVCLLHSGAVIMLLISGLSLTVKLSGSGLALFSLLMFLYNYVQIPKINISSKLFPKTSDVVWKGDDGWELYDTNGGTTTASLTSSSFVHPWITIVNLQADNASWYRRNRRLIFLPDNIDDESFRRLRVRLRWYSTPDPDSLQVLK